MDWIQLIDKIITVALAVLAAYYSLRERVVKVEAALEVLKKDVTEHKTENGSMIHELKTSIDKLTNTINKLEKSIVRLETLNEK